MKNIYVYDKRKYFVIYLKRKFSKNYNVKGLDDVKLMVKKKFMDDDIGIFVANNVNDVVAFFRFRDWFDAKIILCTDNIKFSEKYRNTFKIPCLDISRPKKQFYEDLKDNIDFLFVSES